MQPRIARPLFVRLLLGCALVLAAPAVRAEPQVSTGLTLGAAGVGLDRKIWAGTAFHLGLHGDVLFGTTRSGDFGVGPYVEVLTNGFREIQFGGGISGLVPVTERFPLMLSVGAYGRKGSEPSPLAADAAPPLEPGIAGELFFGNRGYNFHANYAPSLGVVGQMRYGLGPSRETSIVIAAQLDLAYLAIPFLMIIGAARGGSPAAAPVR